MTHPDNSAATLARRRWNQPEALRARIATIEAQIQDLAAKRRELIAKLASTPDAQT